jgi:predicted metal-binding membrane protein
MGGLVALAWLSLFIWGQSPYARFLSHEELEHVSFATSLGIAFVAGWTLMTVAMMLPTSLPLLTLFHTITRKRHRGRRLVFLVIAGYLGAWILFGVVVHIGDWVLHRAVVSNGWLDARPWLIGALTFLLAGLYQFSSLKYRCLEKCRSPWAFIAERWHGRNAQKEAWLLGVSHGIYCLGCCWSLMLLMFAIGVGNLGWMLGLGTVMAIEKNVPWGRELSTPVGIALLASAVGMTLPAIA